MTSRELDGPIVSGVIKGEGKELREVDREKEDKETQHRE